MFAARLSQVLRDEKFASRLEKLEHAAALAASTAPNPANAGTIKPTLPPLQLMWQCRPWRQQAAKVAVDEHADWEAHQADLAEASRLQQLQPEIHAEATATLEAAARTRAAAHDAPD